MVNPIGAASDIAGAGSSALKTVWQTTRGLLAAATISTAIAAATGGLSLTADAAVAAGESIKLTQMDMLENVGQGFIHNLHGGAEILSGWMTPDPA